MRRTYLRGERLPGQLDSSGAIFTTGLVGLRELAPVIAQLKARHQLNVLSIEAVAAAVHLGATVALSARSPRLEAALAGEGRPVEVVA